MSDSKTIKANFQINDQISFINTIDDQIVNGTYKGIKRLGAHSYVHVEIETGAMFVPFCQIIIKRTKE